MWVAVRACAVTRDGTCIQFFSKKYGECVGVEKQNMTAAWAAEEVEVELSRPMVRRLTAFANRPVAS